MKSEVSMTASVSSAYTYVPLLQVVKSERPNTPRSEDCEVAQQIDKSKVSIEENASINARESEDNQMKCPLRENVTPASIATKPTVLY